MNKLASVVLKHENDIILEDVELWSASNNVEKNVRISETFNHVPMYINHRMVPLHLVLLKPASVFSENIETEKYFKTNLLSLSLQNDNISLVYKDDNGVYLVLYYDKDESQIKSLLMDFTITQKLEILVKNNSSLETLNMSALLDLTGESTISKNANTSIFDKVLSQKRQNSNPFLAQRKTSTSSLSSVTLNTSEQISSSVNKIILSGLRIRGLSTNFNHSLNDKLTIKEIYQMTYKSTMFSLRKFNYGFNNSKNYSVKLNDIQDTVEKLLQIFIDVDDISTNSTPKVK